MGYTFQGDALEKSNPQDRQKGRVLTFNVFNRMRRDSGSVCGFNQIEAFLAADRASVGRLVQRQLKTSGFWLCTEPAIHASAIQESNT